MTRHEATATISGLSALIRNEPVQERSTARLTALLDAAAAVVHEIGYERLTTAMVADRAGASIGTVYRYFPDRIAVLQSLAARNFERLHSAARLAVTGRKHADIPAALEEVFGAILTSFKTEPGFASLRLGDVIDLRPAADTSTAMARFARDVLEFLPGKFDVETDSASVSAFEGVLIVNDALLSRAFSGSSSPDRYFLERARAIVGDLLADQFGPIS